MFREAFSIARNFTWPVVISHRTVSGPCAAGIGSLVIVNDEGWALTVGHLIDECIKLETSQPAVAKHEADLAAIKGDRSLRAKDRGRRIAALGRQSPSAIRNFSYWWGKSGVDFVDVTAIKGFDIAVGRLTPFDPGAVASYPILKDPEKDVEPGESLCTLGFPFHTIEPDWDEANQTFVLPPGAVPLPLFPIDGILARFIDVRAWRRAAEVSAAVYGNVLAGVAGPKRRTRVRRARHRLGHSIAHHLVPPRPHEQLRESDQNRAGTSTKSVPACGARRSCGDDCRPA